MKFGVSCGFDWLPAIKNAGFDYLETALGGFLSATDAELLEYSRLLEKHDMKVEVINCFFAPGTALYTPEVDLPAIAAHADRGLSLAKKLGTELAVIGSGKARGIPDGMTREETAKQFCNILSICGDAAAKYGIKIALEPLRFAETTFIHTVAEGVEIEKQTNHENVGMLIDFFHFYMNEEPLSNIDLPGKRLFHAHLARPNADRQFPKEEDADVIRVWAERLKATGYDCRLSLECGFDENNYEKQLVLARERIEVFR